MTQIIDSYYIYILFKRMRFSFKIKNKNTFYVFLFFFHLVVVICRKKAIYFPFLKFRYGLDNYMD